MVTGMAIAATLAAAWAVHVATAADAPQPTPPVQAEMKTQAWANDDAAFDEFAKRVFAMNGRNLLARKGVRMDSPLGQGALMALVDGEAGTRGDYGRVFISGQPTVITCYLGQVKPIHEVGLLTFNIDSRSNQDYEVRFADNSAQPGKMPTFSNAPAVTTGPVIVGADRGGFHTSFRAKGGGPLARADWVEFRVWQTYPTKAGDKAHAGTGGMSAIELEVFGEASDVIQLSEEEKALRARIRKAPKNPPYEKKATWLETMLAAHEAILRWECDMDDLSFPLQGARVGPWHVVGPVDAKEAQRVERLKTVDLAAACKAKDGKELKWQERKDLKDGQMLELKADPSAAGGGEFFLLCRTLENDVVREGRDGSMAFGVGGTGTTVRLVGTGYAVATGDAPAVPNQKVWTLSMKPGKFQVLAKVPVRQGHAVLWFCPQSWSRDPGAGDVRTRTSRRENLHNTLRRDFQDPLSQAQITWEQDDFIWCYFERRAMGHIERFLTDWVPGQPTFLVEQYRQAIAQRVDALEKELSCQDEKTRKVVGDWLAAFVGRAGLKRPDATAAAPPETPSGAHYDAAAIERVRGQYHELATMQEALVEAHRAESMRLAVEDQRSTFGTKYPKASEYLARIGELAGKARGLLAGRSVALADVLALREQIDQAGQDILLANPVLDFEKLLLVTGGGPGFNSNWGGPNRLGSEIAILSPVRPDGKLTSVYKGPVSDVDLNWDAKRILFSDGRIIREVNVDGTGLRDVTRPSEHVQHYDACYLPNGRVMFVSTACEQAVPCTGQPGVGNMHLAEPDGSAERRLTYDQDHNWNPTVLNNGRVLYTRWEYTDTPHYFTRLLFHMNPDGTGQSEFYGSNSYWPNAMYWPRPIPGHPSKIVCVVSGHHGVARMGELLLLDPGIGRHEAEGAIQRIPGRGRKVEPIIRDDLVNDSWPRFVTPWPLGDPFTGYAAGKYFLAAVKLTPYSPWGIYLVDVFDNMTPLLMGGHSMPIPLRPRPLPTRIPDAVDVTRNDALVYMVDVYEGGGLKGFARGSIKALRIGSHHYRYPGNGDTRASSYEGGWDIKQIIGTVPVHEDGSALFRVPANTPIWVQPLDEQGRAQQQMRSWFTAMPGEVISCVGCHERQNQAPPPVATMATRIPPADPKPWYGPPRGFSFEREVQVVLDRKCAGCHTGANDMPDFRAKSLHKDFTGPYSPAYMALQKYVRRPGYEADYHLAVPAEWEAQTSVLVQMLLKGHHNVRLSREEWDRLYTWIDLNVPYPASWQESHRPPEADLVTRRSSLKKKYAAIDDRDEQAQPLPPVAAFEPPTDRLAPPLTAPPLEGWPLTPEQAKALQTKCGLPPKKLDLGEGVSLELTPIPSGRFVMGQAGAFDDEGPPCIASVDQPFYIARLEVTNAQYARFDPLHDSGYIEARGKDRFTRGTPINEPDQPVVRVSWRRAMAFCRWLSEKTGQHVNLPTEAQWEWACRAGTDGAFCFEYKPGVNNVGNFADGGLAGWNYGRGEQGYSDGARYSVAGGKYPPNAWGLCDMHGNVAEWTLSAYRPYPYVARDGRNDPAKDEPRVVRGGSWNDTLRFSRSASRWRYPAYQPVYNVGFRVVVQPGELVQR